ncbi:MAG: FAD-binding oxidoreductase [Gammaproteobacteria bacterium]|nr:FAD-binding oxidoreductase [Gammaproteobacteria bacterium]
MSVHKAGRLGWNRRDFVRAGLATGGCVALACAQRGILPAFAAADPVSNLDDLARSVHGRLLRGSSPGYDEARKVWNLACDRRPLAMVRAADLDDVRRCVEFARRHTVPIAIRGGGHSYAGYGVADGALQIDLGTFSTVSVDRDRRVASVGGGTRIRELLSATLAAGLYTPMGSCGSVGVAGLTLAGGDTSGRGLYGTACDNLIGAQLVTADGEVRELGPHTNEDLYWAIRGGGGNFGVVTRLDFRLYPVVPLHSAAFNLGWRDIAGALRAYGDLVRDAPDEARAGFFVDPDSGASTRCGYRGDAAAATAYLGKWQAAFRPVEAQLSTSTPDPQGEVWAATHLAVDGAFLEDLSGGIIEVLARAALEGRGVGQMLLGLSNGVVARIPMTATAYPLRGTGLSTLIAAEWHQPEARARAERWVSETGTALRPWARRAYVNYLPPSTPERIREIYGVNYPRLARIKAQYDPANLFRENQNIRPEVRSH